MHPNIYYFGCNFYVSQYKNFSIFIINCIDKRIVYWYNVLIARKAISYLFKRRQTMREFTKDELYDAIVTYQEAVEYIRENHQKWYDTVGQSNEMQSDILHHIEFNEDMTYDERIKLVELLHKAREERRYAKNMQSLFNGIYRKTYNTSALFSAIEDMKIEMATQRDGRKYTPRVLEL